MNNLDQLIIEILNNWHDNLAPVDESDYVKFEFNKNKFRNKYLSRTGEFLKITKKIEAISFNKICSGLSANYTFTEKLLDQYLDWCFDNYDFFIKKYKTFNLNIIAQYAVEWDKNFLKFEDQSKITIKDLNTIEVHKNILNAFEIYGIPLAATKLAKEKSISFSDLKKIVLKKLNELTNSKQDLLKLKNMLRSTVENQPYSSELIFYDYIHSLSDLFIYFKNEPWCP